LIGSEGIGLKFCTNRSSSKNGFSFDFNLSLKLILPLSLFSELETSYYSFGLWQLHLLTPKITRITSISEQSSNIINKQNQ